VFHRFALLFAAIVLSALSATSTAGSVPINQASSIEPGELTLVRPYLIAADPARVEITPLLTSGDIVADYQMAGVPDGLGAYRAGDDVVLYMNHELTQEEETNLSAARVSRLVLDSVTGAVKHGEYLIDGTEGYWALCSATLVGPEVGFAAPVFLTGEETVAGPHGGIVLGIDAASGTVTELPWLGAFRHENQVVIPGFPGKTVLLLTDDDALASELYLYVADDSQGLLHGRGQLYVFTADDGTTTADIAKGISLTGRFVPIDQTVVHDAAALQRAVEAAGAFRFVRLEDATHDRAKPGAVYFADNGDDAPPNLATPTGAPLSQNGRLYHMQLDPSDPTLVTSLRVLLNGDDGDDLRNPDNIDATETTVMIQEDLNWYNRYWNLDGTAGADAYGNPVRWADVEERAPGRVLAYDVESGAVTVVARIDQSDAPDRFVDIGYEGGAWESSGIIDASDFFGPGAWLLDVQAHTALVPQFGGVDEGGQLLLLQVKNHPPI
jgi:secreted PhoX family phosphatase